MSRAETADDFQTERMLVVQLPGVVSWARPRKHRHKAFGYPDQYISDRDGWIAVIRARMTAFDWEPFPRGTPLYLGVAVVGQGHDLDRVLTAIQDCLQHAGAIADDRDVTGFTMASYRLRRGEQRRVVVRLRQNEPLGSCSGDVPETRPADAAAWRMVVEGD